MMIKYLILQEKFYHLERQRKIGKEREGGGG